MYKRRTSSRTAAARSTKAPVGKIKAPPQTRRARSTTKRGQTRRSRSRSQSRSPEMIVTSPPKSVDNISPKSVKSQTNMDITSAVAAAPPVPYIIFHENEIGASSESDSYRPIIVINRPLFSNSGKNTAYYRSSGRSNEQLNRVYSNTWFPIAGLIERGGYVNANGKTIPYGFILKANAILSEILTIGEKKSYKWIYDTLIDYFNNTVPENYKTHINLIRLDNKPYDPTNASYFREIKNDLMDTNKHDDESVDYFEKIVNIIRNNNYDTKIFYPSSIYLENKKEYRRLECYLLSKERAEKICKLNKNERIVSLFRIPQLISRSNYNILGFYEGKSLSVLDKFFNNFFEQV